MSNESLGASIRRNLFLIIGIYLGSSALVQAQPEIAMPLEVHERLWESPGPAQDGVDAPKLLIVSPSRDGSGGGRYAGRVEPDTAQVTLNGESLKIWPGGTFIGIKPLQPGQTQVWKFVAESEQKTTTVERTVSRAPNRTPPPAAPRRPLRFYAAAVSPEGDYWLPKEKPLAVTLWGSEDAKAEYRVGTNGEWKPMQAGATDARRGGRYTAKIESIASPNGDAATTPTLLAVEFRLRAPEISGDGGVISMASGLRLARVPDDPPLARITKNLGTFLKDSDSWDRWGNWIAKTPFPVLEARDGRIRTDFGRGETGWVEVENAKIDWSARYGSLPSLPDPEINKSANRVVLRWPDRASPAAIVFNHALGGDGDQIKIDMPGVAKIPDKNYNVNDAAGFNSLEIKDGAGPRNSPQIDVALKGPLWGFGMRANPFQIDLRTKPRLNKATADKPLLGLKVMIDAGHGGSDSGAIGPSGVTESDLNLVDAAWLEKDLLAMGATVKQIRRDDRRVELDARVDMAIAWDPDLFISLHHNAGGGGDPLADSGPIAFYHYDASEQFAKLLSERLVAQWPDAKPRARPEVFRVNRNVSLCPSVLIELGFVTNPADEYKLRQSSTIQRNAKLISEAVRDFMKQ